MARTLSDRAIKAKRIRAWQSAHDPGLASRDEFLQVAVAFALLGLLDLFANRLGIAFAFDRAEHAERLGEIGLAHPAEKKCEAAGAFLIVHEQVIGRHVLEADHFRAQ